MKIFKMPDWDRPTFWMHYMLGLCITIQLISSLGFEYGSGDWANYGLDAHILFGTLAFVIIIIHWLWLLTDPKQTGFKHLFSYNKTNACKMLSDLKKIKNGTLPETGPRAGLPGFVEGLALILVSIMALTGVIFYYGTHLLGFAWSDVSFFHSVHVLLAIFVWIYWFAHVGMACWHGIKGH